jgi:tRNA A-37 threonylcarbamoyl transferase component Bud32
MGTVIAARHELLDVRVAVKLLSPELVAHSAVVVRFLREARAAARLQSEHVARVMDVGTLSGGQPYIVMDLLEGQDLEHRLQGGPVAIHDAVDWVLQALEGMAHAHAAGIVHRDLKPANLFLTSTPDGREIVKVLDFGIAKLSDVEPRGGVGTRSGVLTEEHSALGSPSYMAPEQVRGSHGVNQRADIWALGAILYELVTGNVAFGGMTIGEVFGAVLHEKPTPMRQLRPDTPLGLESLVARCLEREPAKRFANVAEVARALAPFGSGNWVGHVARIEQTLARAKKAGIAKAGVPRRSIAPGAETVLEEPDAERDELEVQLDMPTEMRRLRKRPKATIVALVSLGAMIAAVTVLMVVRALATTPAARAPWPPASTTTEVAAVAPLPQAAPPENPQPVPSNSAPLAPSPPPAALGIRAAKPLPHHVPQAQKSGTSRSRLPGVLDSPE